jgi:hypothetical protein
MPADESKATKPTESKSLSEARMTSEVCSTVFMKWMSISASRHSSTTWCLLAVWLPELESKTEPELAHDSSTACLIRGYRQLKDKKL